MKKFYQDEWFGIQFSSFSTCDGLKIADVEFYNKFYAELYKRYHTFDDLPDDWKKNKTVIADFLIENSQNQRIFSIGCGNGYIEYLLSLKGKDVVAIEPSVQATAILRQQKSTIKLYNGFFPECLVNEKKCSSDIGYMGAVDYVFDNRELEIFLKKIKAYGFQKFILMTAGIEQSDGFLSDFKSVLKKIIGKKDKGQLWGYLRTSAEFKHLFLSAGFNNIKTGYLQKDVFWIQGS